MSQFDSELAANETRARFEALSRSSGGLRAGKVLFKLIWSALDPKSTIDLANQVDECLSAFKEDREAETESERRHLLSAMLAMLKRHDKTLDEVGEMQSRIDRIETRLEQGFNVALRFPNDGSATVIERLAIVVVRGAVDFMSNPQEQTNEFLRIAAQITESESMMLKRIYEFQEGTSRQVGHSANQGNWLSNVASAWIYMNKKYTVNLEEWMQRKSALVRLESYGFVEKMPGNATAEGGEMGQLPYALLPLGREFHEYTTPEES